MNDSSEPPRSGLFAADRRQVPLEGVRIDARLAGLATEVTVAQRYRNREAVPVEAVYVFPFEEGAAVCGFEVRIGGRVVRGRVEEREEAFEIYDDAMAEGHGAFLLDQERPDVFTASVGNLRPDESVEIRITYVALARFDGSALRFAIPTTVSPRYVPEDVEPEVGQPDAERVNPDRWLSVPYGLELKVEVEAGSGVLGVESPSHPVRVTPRAGGATVELARERAALDRDFVLLVELAEPHRPAARVARDDRGDGHCQVTFHPDLESRDAGPCEVLFLLDCSGSMSGDSIDQARRALALSIRALEEGDTFGVVRFGTTFESLWESPRPFDERTLEAATRWVESAGADLGGTEILTPLRRLLELPPDPARRRQILLLTDGEVANEHAIVDLAEEHAGEARIFTFGIGAGPSEYLVRELARVTRGAAEFIFPGERIEPKVLRTFGRVRTPALDDVRLDWGSLEVEQAPAATPPVFAGDVLTVFGRVTGGESGAITLSAGGESWSLDVDLDRAEDGGPIPTLWARETIRDLERGVGRGSAQKRREKEERRRRRLVELGRRYGLVSSATSYVAVEERPEGERVETPGELRKIPIALTAGWGGRGRLVAPAAGGPLPAAAPLGVPGDDAFHDAYMLASAPASAAAVPVGSSVLASAQSLVTNAVGDMLQRLKAKTPARQVERLAKPVQERAAKRRAADPLYALLMTQKADGSFRLTPALRDRLGPILAAVERAAAEHGEAFVATAVVVALLERDEAAREGEWRAAARKARKWLERQPARFDAEALLAEVSTAPV